MKPFSVKARAIVWCLVFGSIVTFAVTQMVVGFPKEQKAIDALEAAGWTHIQITESQMGMEKTLSGCSDEDAVAYIASGINPAGIRSGATVCCDFIVETCAIRF